MEIKPFEYDRQHGSHGLHKGCRRQPNNARRHARSLAAGHREKREFVAHPVGLTRCPLLFFSTASHSTSQLSQRLKTTYKASTSKVCLDSLCLCSYMTRGAGGGAWGGSKRIGRAEEPRRATIIVSTFFVCHPAPVQSPRQNRWSSHLQCGHAVVGRRFMGNFLNALVCH